MSRLVLINGSPGSGKSTLAAALAQDRELALALDVDALKHALGRWGADPMGAGLQARRLAVAVAGRHLADGFDVVVGQYLARTGFIEELAGLASGCGAGFHEFVLELDAGSLARRLAARAAAPDRPEHAANNSLVGPGDATALVASLEPLRAARPAAVWVDARGSLAETLALVRARLAAAPGH